MAHVIDPKYCQNCGGTLLEPVMDGPGGPPYVCTSCGMPAYLDPKVAAAAVVQTGQGVVLLKRAQKDQAHGRWILPGGHVDRGEEVSQAALREVAEETGLKVELQRLLGVYSYPGNPVVLIVFLARSNGGRLQPDGESLEIGTFLPPDIPWDFLGYPSTAQALQDFLKQQNP